MAGPHRLRSTVVLVPLAMGVLAAAIRIRLLVQPSRYFYGTYDDGVHFTAALNFVFGNLPYKDVLFLQPPGIILATAPFAAMAQVVGDAHAFAAARLAFVLIGATSAALVSFILRRRGVVAQLVGGLLYAVSWPAAYTERTTTLEVIGTTGVLVAVLLLQLARPRPLWILLAGVAAGTAIGFKVWYVVPFVILAIAAGRRVGWFLLGGGIAGGAIYLPFFLQDPSGMWRDVVTAQLGRPMAAVTLETRVLSMLGVDEPRAHSPAWQLVGLGGALPLLALLVVFVVIALLTPGARLYVALLAGCAGVLLASPSYFAHYAILTAAPLALVGGVGADRIATATATATRARWVPAVVIASALILALSVNIVPDLSRRSQKVLPVAALKAAVGPLPGCVVADDPTVLIIVNRVSVDLRRGCRVQADPSGVGYVLTQPGKPNVRRSQNPAFQREILHYFQSSTAYLFIRGTALGLTPASQAELDRDRVLFERGNVVLRAPTR